MSDVKLRRYHAAKVLYFQARYPLLNSTYPSGTVPYPSPWSLRLP